MDDLKQNIRKWNHDILTHMIGITYLMDMQRYPEAERYCEKILNSLSSFSETFRAHTMSPDSDSVSESHVPTDYLPDGFIEYQEKLPAEINSVPDASSTEKISGSTLQTSSSYHRI